MEFDLSGLVCMKTDLSKSLKDMKILAADE